MIYLYYSEHFSTIGQNLKQAITADLQEQPVLSLTNVESLARHLTFPQRPVAEVILVVLLAGNKTELLSLLQLRELLVETPLILIVPDQEEKTVALGHSLYPRFLGSIDDNHKTIAEIIKNITTTTPN
ncbi:MAG: hypothetical protein OEY01_14930 [Desulfobulbaceae bacterium]|nr:hypothetical protein [Desulfobulbaceae bacterium]HIJ79882.1 hypothetical protein [Deltaproteobacteria bacterium]